MVAVESVGGRPSHRKRSTATFKPEKSKRPKFCWNCGQSHKRRKAKFCIECGKPCDESSEESDDEEEASCAGIECGKPRDESSEESDDEEEASSCAASSAM